MVRQLLLACIAVYAAISSAATIEGKVLLPQIPPNTPESAIREAGELHQAALSHGSAEAPGARIVLNGGQRTTIANADGRFRLENVPSGIYTLEIFHAKAVYSMFRLQVSDEVGANSIDGTPAPSIVVVEYKYPGAPKWPSAHPIEARPVAAALYFDPKPSAIDLSSLIRNPIILMMGVMGLLLLCMRGMDPEEMKAAQAQQKETMEGMGLGALSDLLGPAQAPRAPAGPRTGADGVQPVASGGGSGRDSNPTVRRRNLAATTTA